MCSTKRPSFSKNISKKSIDTGIVLVKIQSISHRLNNLFFLNHKKRDSGEKNRSKSSLNENKIWTKPCLKSVLRLLLLQTESKQ